MKRHCPIALEGRDVDRTAPNEPFDQRRARRTVSLALIQIPEERHVGHNIEGSVRGTRYVPFRVRTRCGTFDS